MAQFVLTIDLPDPDATDDQDAHARSTADANSAVARQLFLLRERILRDEYDVRNMSAPLFDVNGNKFGQALGDVSDEYAAQADAIAAGSGRI